MINDVGEFLVIDKIQKSSSASYDTFATKIISYDEFGKPCIMFPFNGTFVPKLIQPREAISKLVAEALIAAAKQHVPINRKDISFYFKNKNLELNKIIEINRIKLAISFPEYVGVYVYKSHAEQNIFIPITGSVIEIL